MYAVVLYNTEEIIDHSLSGLGCPVHFPAESILNLSEVPRYRPTRPSTALHILFPSPCFEPLVFGKWAVTTDGLLSCGEVLEFVANCVTR